MQLKDIVKSKVKIDELFERNGHNTHIVNGGSKARCLCPFHNERTPSCWLDLDKNLFFCFGCKKGGDIFEFIKYKHNLNNFNDILSYFQKEYDIESINEENVIYENYIKTKLNKYFNNEEDYEDQNLSLLSINVYFLTKKMRKYCEKNNYSPKKLPTIFNLYKIVDLIVQETFEDKTKLKENIEKIKKIDKYFDKELKINA